MTLKLIVIVSLAAVVTSSLETKIAFSYIDGYGNASPTVLEGEESEKKTPDPAVRSAYDTHIGFSEKQYVKPPYHYSYAYELHNATTNVTQSQYESRYGDVAIGTFVIHHSDGSRSIVDYTVDTPNGFHGLLRKDFQGHPVHLGYARFAGPLAYAARLDKKEYTSRTTLVPDPAASEDPLIKDAFRTHRILITFFDMSAPFNTTWGYELIDAETGRRSQYETYQGETGEGSYVKVELDGTTKSKIAYSVSPKGVAFTSPETFA